MTTVTKRLDQISGVSVLRGLPTSRTVSEGDIPVRSIASLRHEERATRFANRDDLGRRQELVVQPGDLLVSIGGPDLGECVVVPDGGDLFIPTQQVAIVRMGTPREVDPWFLAAWFDSEHGRHQLDGLMRSTVVPRVSIDDMARIRIPVPDAEVQERLAKRYRAFEESIEAHRVILADTQRLKDVELTLAFAGESTTTTQGD